MTIRLLRLAALAVTACLLAGCVIIPIGLPSPPEVKQVVYKRGSGWKPDKIAIIEVSGVLRSGGEGEGFFSSDSSVVDLSKKLKVARQDKSIKAVILRVDTPGGGVTASDLMYHELKRFRKDRKIPVYVSMQTVAASGGYYVSMGADKIYATPTTLTGSIGVIGTFPEAKGLMGKIGLDVNAIKSGGNKDAGAFYREMSEEDRQLYQAIIDDYFNQFLSIVLENRTDVAEDEMAKAADGRVYTATQAQAAGLIDGIMYLEEVIEKVKEENHLKKPSVVIIKRTGRSSTDSLYATSAPGEARTGDLNLLKVDAHRWLNPAPEVFNYLWIP